MYVGRSDCTAGKHARLLTDVKLEEPEYAVVVKTQRVVELLEETARTTYETAVEGRSFFYGLSSGLGQMIEAYEREEYAVVGKHLREIEERIVELQRRYGDIQGGVFRVFKLTGEVEDLTTQISMRMSRAGQELTKQWPAEKVSVVAGLSGLLGGFVLMWASPLLGFAVGAGGGALVGVNQRIENGRAALVLVDDSAQLQMLAAECQSVMYGLERFNATLDSLRIAVRESREAIQYLRYQVHSAVLEDFQRATAAVRAESDLIVAQHNELLETWYKV